MTDKLKKYDRLKKPTTYGGRLVGRRLVGARAHDYGECGFPGVYSYRCGFPCSRDAPLSYREAFLHGHSRNFLDGKIPPSQVRHAFSL
jgi:hypothetical protein